MKLYRQKDYALEKMRIVPKETIEVIAQSIGISNLSPDVSLELASDVEYRVSEIMQEAIKCMRHSKRTIFTGDDVDRALKLRNMEPVYGFTSGGDPLRFKRATGHKDLFYVDDKDVEFKEIIEAPLRRAPLDTTITSGWLAIEGLQPAVVENEPIEVLSGGKNFELKDDELVNNRMPIKHMLPRELKLYFEKITELSLNKSGSIIFKEALVSLATNSGLHPLLPCFTCFIADEVAKNLTNIARLFALMRLVRSLLQNPHIHIELYLHQLMPSIITCLVARQVGNRLSDNHWELRDFAASLVARICRRFGHIYHNLQPRAIKSLLHTFLDPSKALPQQYGAIKGLASLGPSVIRLLLLPNLEPYLQLLKADMDLEKQKNGITRHEAWQVYGILLCAAGQCVHNQLKNFRGFLPPPNLTFWKRNGKVAITNKRKASAENLTQQPPLKKMAAEGAMGGMPMNHMVADMQGAAGGYNAALGVSGSVAASSMSRPLPNEIRSAREGSSVQGLKAPNVLTQAWREDVNAGQLLESAFEIFGESMFSFTAKPELSSFFL